jgi:hypothetical protein
MDNKEEKLKTFNEFCKSDHDCECFDKSFEEFNQCCGKKHGIQNPLGILDDMVESMSKQSKAKRLKDMEPQEAQKTLEKIFKVLDGQ